MNQMLLYGAAIARGSCGAGRARPTGRIPVHVLRIGKMGGTADRHALSNDVQTDRHRLILRERFAACASDALEDARS